MEIQEVIRRWRAGSSQRQIAEGTNSPPSNSSARHSRPSPPPSPATRRPAPATRAGDTLGADEMQAIIQQLAETAEPHRCPHGRPTVVQISTLRLEQEFRRR